MITPGVFVDRANTYPLEFGSALDRGGGANGGKEYLMSKKSLVAAMLCAAVVTGANASAAFAGEITGTGEPTGATEHANSICVFSGKNDDPDAPLTDPLDPGGVSQSYGQLNKLGSVDPHEFNPGDACRGGSN